MAGYYGYSMSNNAVDAYRNGLRPLSQLKSSHLKLVGWPHSLSFAKFLAKIGQWESYECHHTSKEFNCTNFYSPEILVEWWQDEAIERQQELLDMFKAEQNKTKCDEQVCGEYTEFSGSRRHPKTTTVKFTGTLRGNWIYLKSGRKKANGNHIRWRRVNEENIL